MCFFIRPSILTAPSVGASDLDAGAKRQENETERERERSIKALGEKRAEKGTSASRATFALPVLALRVSFHSFARKVCTRCRYACHAAPAEG